MQTELPLIRAGRYGTVSLDHAACGRGYVVDFRASEWVKWNWGDKSRWATFQSYHTALAYFWALSGLHESRHRKQAPPSRISASPAEGRPLATSPP